MTDRISPEQVTFEIEPGDAGNFVVWVALSRDRRSPFLCCATRADAERWANRMTAITRKALIPAGGS